MILTLQEPQNDEGSIHVWSAINCMGEAVLIAVDARVSQQLAAICAEEGPIKVEAEPWQVVSQS